MKLDRLPICLLTILTIACGSRFDGEVVVTGRTVAFDNQNNTISIRKDSIWKKIELKGDTTKSYGGLIWSNTTDDFLAIEYSKNKIGRTVEGDIVKVDIHGNLLQKVLDFGTGELTGNLCLSKHDNKLLFSLEHDFYDPDHPLDQLNRPVDIWIMDYKNGEILKKLDTVGLSMNVWIRNNPWLSDENRFIYDFRTDRKIKIAGDNSEDVPLGQPGIYLYNIERNEHSSLIAGGYSGEVSPTDDKIAYLKDKAIWVYDVATKSNDLLYKLGKKESASSVEWTPDGKYVYFVSYEDFMFDLLFNSYSNLIRLQDKRLMKINEKNRYD